MKQSTNRSQLQRKKKRLEARRTVVFKRFQKNGTVCIGRGSTVTKEQRKTAISHEREKGYPCEVDATEILGSEGKVDIENIRQSVHCLILHFSCHVMAESSRND